MTVHVFEGAVGRRPAISAADVRRMTEVGILGEDGSYELLGGELIERPSKSFGHDRTRDALCRRLVMAVGDEIAVSVAGTLQLDELTLLEPDVLVFMKEAFPSADGYRVVPSAHILLAVEVALTSLAYDRRRKASRYAAYGVAEYWIVDLNKPRVFIHGRPVGGRYEDVREVAAQEPLRPSAAGLRGFEVRLADLL